MLMDPRTYAMPRFPYGSAHFPPNHRPVFGAYGQADLLGNKAEAAKLQKTGYTWLAVGAGAGVVAAFLPRWWMRLPLIGLGIFSVQRSFEPLCTAGIMEKSMDELGAEAGGVLGKFLASLRGA
jgi:hypothetical protein